jgi:signal transduction histidine kinase/DNA-binding response OmpR family regulator/HPt (histidine-containing phosphotransfer) domain-containing protein
MGLIILVTAAFLVSARVPPAAAKLSWRHRIEVQLFLLPLAWAVSALSAIALFVGSDLIIFTGTALIAATALFLSPLWSAVIFGSQWLAFMAFGQLMQVPDISELTVINSVVMSVFAVVLGTLNYRREERSFARKRQAETAQAETERARLEADRANRAKSSFLATMSHEIRTPLNAMIGMSDLALRTELTPKQKDYISKAHVAGLSLLRIINDILDFSKIEAGRLELESTPFALENVLDALVPLVSRKAADKGIEYVAQVEPEVPGSLIGDADRLSQVLLNLVSNAVKFTDTGTVSLSVEVQEVTDQRVLLRFDVSDTGIGMTEEQTARLFQPFVQADGSTTRKYGGTGLGLSICRRLVEMMNGSISVRSQAGAGSTFTFSAWFTVGSAQPLPRATLPEGLNGLRVLVVDDNATARGVMLDLLSCLPLRVDAVASGSEALTAVEQGDGKDPYGLVLMDWKMPEMDGGETTRRIKSHTGLGTVPRVVMVTAYGQDEVREETAEAGADGFLVKPVSSSKLVDLLVRLFAPQTGEASAGPMKPQEMDQPLSGARILLAEDNDINQQIAVELLEGAGASVDVAANGLEAVEKAGKEKYDLILMDLQMPEMDGLEATRRLRCEQRTQTVPVIAMTAHALLEERQRCFDSGMNDHVAKPIDPQALFQTLSRWYVSSVPPAIRSAVGAERNAGCAPPARSFHGASVDVQEALRRARDNHALLARLFRRFVEGYSDAAERIAEMLAAGDLPSARREAHTLKGVSGNVGAREVHYAAAALEHSIAEKACNEEIRQHIACLGQALDGAVREMVGYLDTTVVTEDASVSQRDTDVDAARPLIARLAGLLEEDDGEAADAMEEARALLAGVLTAEEFRALEVAVRDFHFDQALTLLRQVAGRLGVGL